MRYVISGYYGFNNSGDDALLMSIINGIRSTDDSAEITVLSKSPAETRKNYSVNAVNRYNIFSLIAKISCCDVLISGGGTLIQDATSTKSLVYYLSVIRIAKFFKKKVMLYANGIGPLNSFKNIEMTRNILNDVDLITLRDEKSLETLSQIGIAGPEIKLTADPAFLLKANDKGEEILVNYGIPHGQPLMCVSVRRWKNNPTDFTKTIAAFCDYAYEKYGLFTVFVPMQQRFDFDIASEVKDKMKNRSVVIGANYPVESLLSIMSEMSICVGMRLHTLIYSASCTVPTIGIVYDPKVNGFMEYMGEDKFVNVEDMDREKLCALLDDVCGNYDAVRSHMKYNITSMRVKAWENTELLQKLLVGGKR